jgi:hypothetical protein
MSDPRPRHVSCDLEATPVVNPTAANPNPAYITDEMWWLWQQLAVLEPGTQLGGIYANKPGYHNTRNQNSPYDYSVCDRPPDDGGPGDKAAAIDWTFPEAQGGDYSAISVYTKRLLASAQDVADPRLNGWREFYGNADTDSYVEGWDIRYYCAATSDSSHLWHIHLSENRDMTTNLQNKKALLSVLKGEEWIDVSAEEVWTYDIDPSGKTYTAGGAAWTVYNRTDYLANTFAPWVTDTLGELSTQLSQASRDNRELGDRVHRLATVLILVSMVMALAVAVLGGLVAFS